MASTPSASDILAFILKVVQAAPTIQGIIGAGVGIEQTIVALVKGFAPSSVPGVDPATIAAQAVQVHNTWHSADSILAPAPAPAPSVK